MPGLVPGIHVFRSQIKGVDGRAKTGEDVFGLGLMAKKRASAKRLERSRSGDRRRADPKRSPGLPSPEALLEFLRANPEALGTREIARAFGLGSPDQPALRAMLRAVARSGELVRGGDRRFAAGASLPETMPVERSGSDADGFPLVRPVSARGPEEAPLFRLVESAGGNELPEGARALARLIRRESGETEAEAVRRLDRPESRIVGVFRRTRDGGEVIPADRRNTREYGVLGPDAVGRAEGERVRTAGP